MYECDIWGNKAQNKFVGLSWGEFGKNNIWVKARPVKSKSVAGWFIIYTGGWCEWWGGVSFNHPVPEGYGRQWRQQELGMFFHRPMSQDNIVLLYISRCHRYAFSSVSIMSPVLPCLAYFNNIHHGDIRKSRFWSSQIFVFSIRIFVINV